MPIYCSNCGADLPDGVAFCDACGTPVRGQGQAQGQGQPTAFAQGAPSHSSIGSVICPVCGVGALPGEAFCDNCGAALMPSSAYSYAPPASQPQSPCPRSRR